VTVSRDARAGALCRAVKALGEEMAGSRGLPPVTETAASSLASPAAGSRDATRRSEMPKVSDVYKSSYLRAADVEEPLTVTIKSASIEELGEDKDEKIVVLFEELDRGLVLNRTNADYLSMICKSDDTEDWPGTRVGLFVQPVSFKGKLVDSIRVTKPQHLKAADDMAKKTAMKAAKVPKKKKAAATVADDLDDAIPTFGEK
jgi:hypothetical protein